MLVFYLIVGLLIALLLLGAPSVLSTNKFVLAICCVGLMLMWPLVLALLDFIAVKSFIKKEPLFDLTSSVEQQDSIQDSGEDLIDE